MKKHSFYNETFGFNLTLALFDSDKDKSRHGVYDIMRSLGADDSEITSCINNARAFTCGRPFDGFIIFNINGHNDFKGKERSIQRLKTLAHECNHVKENILSDIDEHNGNRETECAMRISDWCYTKCLRVPFFKNLLK